MAGSPPTAGRLLVTGAGGYLGGVLVARAVAAGWSVTGASRSAVPGPGQVRLDVRDRDAVAALLWQLRPDAVVHAAAGYGDWVTTADGSAQVAMAAREVGARLVHVSSDAVFPGSPHPYDEQAVPAPVYAYGAAKAAAETAVRAVAPDAAIVRTSLILGDGRSPHERHVRQLAAGADGGLLTDAVRCPVHVDDLADALLELAAGDHAGVLNVAGTDAVDRHRLGVLIAVRDGMDPTGLRGGTRAELGLVMPGEVRLSVTRAQALLRTRLRGAEEFLRPVPAAGATGRRPAQAESTRRAAAKPGGAGGSTR